MMRLLTLILISFSFLTISNEASSDTTDAKDNTINEIDNTTQIGVEDNSELILSIIIDKFTLGEIFAQKSGGNVLIGMQNLFNILDFPIDVNIDKRRAKGWFIKEENTFDLFTPANLNNKIQVKSKNKSFEVDPSELIFSKDDIYVNSATLTQWLDIKFILNFNDLTMTLESDETLPIQDKFKRRNKKTANQKKVTPIQFPERKTPYQFLSYPFIDVATRYNTNSRNINSYGYSLIGASDLAYMTGNYYANGTDNTSLQNFRLTLSRESLEKKLLGPLNASSFSIGDIKTTPISGLNTGGQEVGVRISNRNRNRVVIFNQTDFVGDIQPGWDVELYRNGLFLGLVTAENDGRYEFLNQDLLYGNNQFKLVFYGPQGQRKEKTENIIIDGNNASNNNIIYDISLSKQNRQLFNPAGFVKPPGEYRRFSLKLTKGIGRSTSIQTAFTNYYFTDNIRHYFIQASLKFNIFSTLFSTNMTKDIKAGESYKLNITRKIGKSNHSISYTGKIQSQNYKTNSTLSTLIKSSSRVNISGPLLSIFSLNYAITSSEFSWFDNKSSKTYELSLSAKLFKLQLTNNFNYSKNYYSDRNSTRNINGSSNASIGYNRLSFRLGTYYSFNPQNKNNSLNTIDGLKSITNITLLNGSLAWYVNNKISTQLGANYIPASNIFNKQFSLNWKAKHFTLVSNMAYQNKNSYTISIGANFSLSYNKYNKKININPTRISNSGAVSALIFSDDNNNGKYDKNEILYKNAKIEAVQARKSIKTDKNGEAFLAGLPIDRVTDIRLDKETLEDPFLTPSTPSFSFLPRPGLVENITIPLVMSGEIEGTVFLDKKSGESQPAGYVPLILTNIKTRKSHIEKSAYDGFYLFSNIPPGQYIIAIDNRYLSQKKLIAKMPMPRKVTINSSGNISTGNNFSVYKIQ